MSYVTDREHIETIVIGGGQAGLSVGYQLKQRGIPFVILDANERIGDAWRSRWDSLRLFTPARFNGLAGMPFPAPAHYFPTKDEMADFLEAYAEHFDLPVRSGVRVDKLTRNGNGFIVRAGEQLFETDNVVVAMSNYQHPRVPSFAGDLDPNIVQLHSSEYRNPSQLRDGGVLIVGAGNSGSELAMEVVQSHPTWVSGRSTGEIPFNIAGFASRLILARLVLRGMFHWVLTVNTPMGRKVRKKVLNIGGPLIRVKHTDMANAGVESVSRVAGVRDGLPVLEEGEPLDVTNVIWCTGFRPGFEWIDLPIHGEKEPLHERGIVPSEPGLYFVGLFFLYSLSSVMVHGLERDAQRIASNIAERRKLSESTTRRTEGVAA